MLKGKSSPIRSTTAPSPAEISVVIPTYNRATLVTHAIRSAQQQSYPVNEIIVVDDASSDNTEEVIRIIALTDPRITYIKHDLNKGAQASRNTGIKKANTEWIAFLDSDDEWLPEKIERQLEVANREHVSVVHCECYKQRGDSTICTLFGVPPYSGNIYALILRHPSPMFPGLFLRKECLEFIGFLNEEALCYQEWDTAIRLAKHYMFGFVPDPLFVYHLHTGETISEDMRRDADGWAQIVRKHETEILREAGSDALKKHYEILCKKYYSVKDYELADLYKHQAINL